jgi:Spy/CpxP family protein refolding chaperone
MQYMKSAIVIIALSMCGAWAAPPAGDSAALKGKDMGNKIAQELGLNADQKTKLKALREEMKTVRKDHMEKMKALRDKSRDELLKAAPAQAVLYGYAKEMGDLHTVMAQKEADHLLKVKAVLTPEQFKKLLSKDFRHGPEEGEDGPHGKGPHEEGRR